MMREVITINKPIYLDNAATTPITKPVLDAMMPYLTEQFGNPSSLYSLGRTAHKAVETAREQIATAINAEPSQILFTSGATESNNWVCSQFHHILCSPYEHHSILNHPNVTPMSQIISCNVSSQIIALRLGIEMEYPDLVTFMSVNNETGVIYSVPNMTDICHRCNTFFHTDATQAFGHIPINVKKLDCDFLSLSGHKFSAPKGVGILYIKDPEEFKPFLYGGQQENHLRAGTENAASIVGMGKAAELYNYSSERDKRCREIQNKFVDAFSFWQDVYFNTDVAHSISSTLNVAFKNVESESLMLLLDMDGICASSGSACNSASLEPSHVLKAIGTPEEYIYNSIRLSWDDTLTDDEVDYVIESIKKNVMKVRGYI